jgi:hypothetical protein
MTLARALTAAAFALTACHDSASAPSLCVGASYSTLPGATFVFAVQRCRYSVAEAQNGIDIVYELDLEEPVGGVMPLALDAGRCEQPGASGLIVHSELTDESHTYCECDVGLCPGDDAPRITLVPGAYSDRVHVVARDWQGPSDTGAALGDPFPPGAYELVLVAKGMVGTGTAAWSYDVVGRYELALTP